MSTPVDPEVPFTVDPPRKPTFGEVMLLFIYHILLAVFLAYAIYNVWPPQPWPGDKAPANANSNTTRRAVSAAGAGNTAATNTSATPTSVNAVAANNGNFTPGSNNNINTGASADIANSNLRSATNTSASVGANANSATATNANNANRVSEATAEETEVDKSNYPPPFSLFGRDFRPPIETRLILLVLLAGAIGSYVHAASSFVDYLGNRTIVSSWIWWYLLRPFIGMMLALIFYFVFRGGFITAGINSGGEAAANFINPFGIAALAALVGMFSKVATDKLNEVFTTLFRPAAGQGDAKRGDKLVPPSISTVVPNKGSVEGGTAVTINGTGFTVGAKVTFGGLPATSVTVVNPTSLNVVTPKHPAGAADIEVTNPDGQKVTLTAGFTYETTTPAKPAPSGSAETITGS